MSHIENLAQYSDNSLVADNVDWQSLIDPALYDLAFHIPGPDDERLMAFARLLRIMFQAVYCIGYQRGISISHIEWVCEED